MPDKRVDLGADLYKLDVMATRNLPGVAGEYATAAATDGGLTGAFSRDSVFGGAQGPAYGPWTELSDTVKKFLGDTDYYLTETAHALKLAVQAYAETDCAASDELKRLRTQNGGGR
jgi:hypothetical protein